MVPVRRPAAALALFLTAMAGQARGQIPSVPAGQDEVEEVRVQGNRRRDTGQVSVKATEIREVPGAFGDAFRAIEALPGVTPLVSGLPFFFVRGAPPGNVGYFLDGIRVPLLYHLGAGPSVIHPGLLDRVDFFTGGYPAQYGRFTGGILAGHTLAPADRFQGEGNLRLFDAGAMVEAPFTVFGKEATFLAGGRYSYTAALLSLAAPDTKLAYWDYQGRLTLRVSDKGRVSVFAFGSFDDLQTRGREGEPFRPVFNTQFHRLDVRYDHDLVGGHLRVATMVGVDSTLFETSSSSSSTETAMLRTRLAGLRVELEKGLSETVRLRAGADALFERYELLFDTSRRRSSSPDDSVGVPGGAAPEEPAPGINGATPGEGPTSSSSSSSSGDGIDRLYPSRNEFVTTVRADVVWKPMPTVEVVPGLRLDLFGARRDANVAGRDRVSATKLGVDPRLATRVAVAPRVTWVTTFGVAHQPPSFFIPVPGLRPANLADGLQTSLQSSQGVEVVLPWDFTVTGTAFLHHYLDLTDITATCRDFEDVDDVEEDCTQARTRGRTVGFEVLLRRPLTKRLTGWVSYTLSRSTRVGRETSVRYDPEGNRLRTRRPFVELVSEFDRPHVLNVVGAYDLGGGFRAGARYVTYSGRPYSRTYRGVPLPPYNDQRMPAFHRVDVRLERRWTVGETGRVSLVLEGMNVLLQKEVVGVQCENGQGNLQTGDPCTFQTVGPITIPSLGVEGAF